jgi:hypothetical protein
VRQKFVMSIQPIYLPTKIPFGLTLVELPADSDELHLGPDDSGIRRGDRQETGDDEAQPTETGSGPAMPTVDPTSLGGTTSIRQPPPIGFDANEELRDNYGMEIVEPTDGRLGLTNIGDVPPDDWAADTGPTKSPESEP